MILVALLLAAAPVTSVEAEGTRPSEAGLKVETGDPHRVICRSNEVTGSRLKSERVCRTAAEWSEIKHDNRNDIEKAQAQKWSKAG